jgi:ATP-dependent DNA helicase RecG
MDVFDVTPDQAVHVISLEEGHFTDVKAIEVQPAKLTRSLSAFADSDGGEFYLGIAEHVVAGQKVRTWRGFPDVEAANGHIQAFEQVFPLGGGVQYEFLKASDHPGLVLHVIVHKSREIVAALDGKPYVRRGAQNLPVDSPAALEQLRRAKGLASFETETLAEATDAITNSETVIGFMLEIVPLGEPEIWLRKQRLIVDGNPTVAGVLLFADEPQVYLPKAAVKIYRYKTTEGEGSRETLAFDPLAIEGCLYDQIRDAVAKTTELIEGIQILLARTGSSRSSIHPRHSTRSSRMRSSIVTTRSRTMYMSASSTTASKWKAPAGCLRT